MTETNENMKNRKEVKEFPLTQTERPGFEFPNEPKSPLQDPDLLRILQGLIQIDKELIKHDRMNSEMLRIVNNL